jgi:hypothetical protein
MGRHWVHRIGEYVATELFAPCVITESGAKRRPIVKQPAEKADGGVVAIRV